MYVTQDVMPFNDDYDMQQLARYNDYLFLMAYDEHNTTSAPGDVASQHWMEKATDWAAKNIPNDKLVLGLANYGYDWADGGDCNTVSYDQTIANAYGANATLLFDDDTYNLRIHTPTTTTSSIRFTSPMPPRYSTTCVSAQHTILPDSPCGALAPRTRVCGTSTARI